MKYDMVWCGTMQKKQHKTIELKKKKKKMRTEQNRIEQKRKKTEHKITQQNNNSNKGREVNKKSEDFQHR